jgi:5-methylcytosine-specific restriction protein B
MTGDEVDITELNGGKNLGRNSVYPLDRVSPDSILSLLKTTEDLTIEEEERPYVFVIDEINRGNISKIFGELITLIEDTKRDGMPEAASAKLPYSGENFSVPNNVYILGTMNTADRSIAIMDTALRRRFRFEEMMPDANVLRSIGANMVEDLDVAAMLEKINERISFLYDREHTIGHAFFTGLKDEPTLEKLASIFKKSVIPLLQEYFYEDYQKIQMILGDNDKTEDKYKFIQEIPVVAKNIFKGNIDDVIDLPKKKYKINEDALSEIQSYREII